MDKGRRQQQGWPLAGIAILLVCLLTIPAAAETAVISRVTQEVADGVQVNAGTDQGLYQGLLGALRLYDGRVFEFEVLNAGRNSSLLHLAALTPGESLLGRTVELAFEPAPPEQTDVPEEGVEKTTPSQPMQKSDERPSGSEETAEFVPLLAPPRQAPDISRPANVSHGRVQIHQMLQTDSETDQSYSVTRMSSSGSVERIGGSPWSFEWSGNQSHPDYQDPRLYMYEAMFQRPIDDGGFLRFGRFLPRELPGIGYVDGLQGESRRGEHLRIGAIAGLKPGRIDLETSADEPVAVGYTTFETGDRSQSYYSGTVGVLGSLYDGEANRLALLFDQRAGFGPNLTLYSTAAVDFDAGAAETRNGTRLTRLDVYGVAKVTSSVRLRAGVDHWERPDNPAERDLLVVDDDRYFDDGYWRYWVGSDQRITRSLRFSEEVSFIDSDGGDDGPRWRLGLTRMGFFGLPDASVTATIYNLSGDAVDGYGGRISGYLPLMDRKLSVQPMAGFRMLDTDPQADDFTLSYLSLRLDGRISKRWSLFGGGTYSFGDQVDSRLFEIGLRYAW
jgi:hypothetical protein